MVVTTLSDRQVQLIQGLLVAAGKAQAALLKLPEAERPGVTGSAVNTDQLIQDYLGELREAFAVVGRNQKARTVEQQRRGEMVYDNAVWVQVTGTKRRDDPELLGGVA